ESPHPLMDSRLRPSAELDMLCDALGLIEAEALRRPTSTEVLDKEITRLQGLLNSKLEDLHALRTRLQASQSLQKSTGPAYSIANIERFLGQLENALETYEKIGTDSDLSMDVQNLRQQVDYLQQRVSEHQIRRRTENALQIVQGIAAE